MWRHTSHDIIGGIALKTLDSHRRNTHGVSVTTMLHLKYLRPVAAIVGIVAVLVAAAHWLSPESDALYREGGVLEDISVGIWFLSALLAVGTMMQFANPRTRLMAVWTSWLALLAALRELDLHIWLNPKHLGEYGVRYRLDWWLSTETSVWLRLGWLLFFVVVIGLAVYPPVRLWKRLLSLLLQGDSLMGFLWVAVIFLLGGFVIDDLLRPVHFVELGTKQLCEETSEMIGALLYFIGMVLHWRRPLDARLQ
jgi:hypothetical protein